MHKLVPIMIFINDRAINQAELPYSHKNLAGAKTIIVFHLHCIVFYFAFHGAKIKFDWNKVMYLNLNSWNYFIYAHSKFFNKSEK